MNQKQGKSKMGLVFLLVIVVVVALYFNSKNDVKINKDETGVSVTVEMYNEAIKLRENLGENTPYTEMFLYAELLKTSKNYDNKEAIKNAATRYIEAEAFMWEAEKENVEPSPEDLSKHIDKLIKKQKEAEEYEEIQAKCDEIGINFEDIFKKNSRFFEYELYMTNVYDKWKAEYDEIHKDENSLLNKFNKEWKDHVKEIIDEYKKSDSYSSKENAIQNSMNAYYDNLTTEELKKADIYF